MIKNYFKYLLAIPALALVTACNTFDEIADAEDITPIGVKVDLEMAIEDLATVEKLTMKFDNYEDDLHYVKEVTGNSIEIDSIVPGIYTVSVSGLATGISGTEYMVNGSLVNKALFTEGQQLNLSVKGLKVSPLIFKEIYYSCICRLTC